MKQFFWAVRYITKSPAMQVVKIVSLTLGLAAGLVLFAKVAFERSENNFFPDRDRVYQVTAIYAADKGDSDSGTDEGPMLLSTAAPYMADNIPAIESATRTYGSWWNVELFSGDSSYTMRTIYGDEHLFDVLDYGMVRGDARAALAAPGGILLSESAAQRIFPDTDPIGQTLLHNKTTPVVVRGVFRDVPKNAAVWFEAIMPLTSRFSADALARWVGGDSFYTYIKLREGATIEDVEPLVMPLFEASPMLEFIEMFGLTLGFHRIDRTYEWREDVKIQYLLLGLAFLVLFIAAMNYVLVAIASLEKRVKAIAMQKCSGASSGGIFGGFLIETALLTLFSLGLALLLLWTFGAQIESMIGQAPETLFAPAQWLKIGAVVAGFFLAAGVIPGRIFSRIPVAHAFKRLKAGKRWWKQALVFLQLLCATVVVIFLVVVVRQYNFVTNRDMGYDWQRVVAADARNIDRTGWERIKGQLESLPYVEDVAYAAHEIPIGMSGNPVTIPGTQEVLSAREFLIEPRFLEFMGIEMAGGRGFNQTASESDQVIINRRLAGILGWDETTAVGQFIDQDGEKGEVVGVTGDFHNAGWAGDRVLPIVIHPMALPEELEPGLTYRMTLHIKLTEVSVRNMDSLRAELEKFLPDQTTDPQPYGELIRRTASSERMIRNLVMITALVILLITLTGLVGYVGDEVRRRRKEIAIRKINGATVGQVIAMVARNLTVVGGAALAFGLGAAYFLGGLFLQNFPQRVPLGVWSFVGGTAFVTAVVLTTIVVRSWRAANENPSITIKAE